jgi:hypothetical protein
MSVCVYCVCFVEALRRADPLSKESYRPCIGSRNLKSGQGPTKGCRTIKIFSRVLVTETGFGLVIGFINRLQVVITINYNTVTNFTIQALHANLLSPLPFVFTIRFLATELNTGIITLSIFKCYT